MNKVEEESVRDFVQYADNEVTKNKDYLSSEQQKKDDAFTQGYEEYKNRKNQFTDNQLSRFKGFNEISEAFDFQAPFEEKLSEELATVVKDFESRKLTSKEEIANEEK